MRIARSRCGYTRTCACYALQSGCHPAGRKESRWRDDDDDVEDLKDAPVSVHGGHRKATVAEPAMAAFAHLDSRSLFATVMHAPTRT